MKVLKALALALPLCLAAQAADAAGCYSRSGFINDICAFGDDYAYDVEAAMRATTVELGGAPYLLYASPNTLRVYDLSNPLADSWKVIGSQNFLRSDDPDTHSHQIEHIRDMAVIDGFPYAVVSLYTYGWDIVQLSPSPSRLNVGWAPEAVEISSTEPYLTTGLFGDGGSVYLIGQRLADPKDNSVSMYMIANATGSVTPRSITYKSMPLVARLPVGGSGDPAPFSKFSLSSLSRIEVATIGAKRYAFVVAGGRSSAIAVIDITTPDFPKPVAYWDLAGYPEMFTGTFELDAERGAMYVTSATDEILHVWDISVPAEARKLTTYRWHAATGVREPKSISLAGDVLAVGGMQTMRYINIAEPAAPVALAPEIDPFSKTESFFTFIDRDCKMAYGDSIRDLRAFLWGGKRYVVRMMAAAADVVNVDASCLDTTPVPGLAVTGPGAVCSGGDARGYPGDAFTVVNASSGSWEAGSAILEIRKDGQLVDSLPFATKSSITWTPPTSAAPGTYALDVTVVGADDGLTYSTATQEPARTKTAVLCAQPPAQLAVTPSSYLTGDTVTASVQASAGHPSGASWVVNFAPVVGAGGLSLPVELVQRGSYQVAAVVHYDHDAPDNLGGCANVDYSFADLLRDGTYDVCVATTLDSQPFFVDELSVTQAGTPASPFMRSTPLAASAPYLISTGGDWTVESVTWTLDGDPSAAITPADTGSAFTAAVNPANFAIGVDHVLQVVAVASSATQQDSVSMTRSFTFQVSDCVPVTAPTGLSPSGTTLAPGNITFSWTRPSAGTGPITYKVQPPQLGGVGLPDYCQTTDTTTCTVPISQTGTITYSVRAINACNTAGSSTSTSFTIQSTTPPPTPPPTPTPTPDCNETAVPVANFSFSPGAPQVGQTIQFTDASTNNPTRWAWDFGFGGIGGIGTSTAQHPTFVYGTAGTYTVTLKATNCVGTSTTVSKQLTVASSCSTPKPVANFTFSPTAPKAGQAIQFTDLTAGTVESYAWNFGYGALGIGTSTQKNPVFTYPEQGTYTVTLTTTNCGGSSVKTATVTVGPACDQSAPPTADFTWAPTGALEGFPEQMQPYVGQQVQLTDASTNAPDSWHWYDFQGTDIDFYTQNVTYTWSSSGGKNVRLSAHNCAGTSAEVKKTITVYADVRHVVADFDATSAELTTGTPIAFTAHVGPDHGDPTTFSWTCDDGETHQGQTIEHTFACRGTHAVTLTASRGTYTNTVTKSFEVAGDSCGPSAVVVTDTAKTEGLNGSDWRTDMRIFNFSDATANVQLRVKGTGGDPEVKPLPALAPHQTLLLEDLLASLGLTLDKASVWLEYLDGEGALSPQALASLPDHHLPNISTRTYTRDLGGGSYGQAIPSFLVYPASQAGTLWLTGMVDNGTVARSEHRGFRTNLTLVNTGGSWAGKTITISMIDADGTVVRQREMGMGPYAYVQYFPATKVFVDDPVDTAADIGPYAMRIEVPEGVGLLAGCSVVDNATNDPFFTLARPRRDGSEVFVAARNPGLLGTTWRTDLQLTNTTEQERTWQLFFQPKGDYPTTAKTKTLAPLATWRENDIIAWLISPYPVPDAIQGQITVSPVGAETDLPAATSRTYNLTDAGTFGQNNPLMHTSMAASEKGTSSRLVITGMSSEDIARTNLGFLNLSSTSDVNITVTFYDEAGTELNPGGFKYWYGAGGWSQVKLEDRFASGGIDLPANQRSISAVIQVTHGGPLVAYASVVDSLTGDPVTILAQPAP